MFHQCLPDGTPVLDCGHIISSLNKLDSADPEQLVLSSRNGKDLLVTSFYDIHRCVEENFLELALQADPSATPGDPNYAASGYGMDLYTIPLQEPITYGQEGRRGGVRATAGTYEFAGRGRGGRGGGGRARGDSQGAFHAGRRGGRENSWRATSKN